MIVGGGPMCTYAVERLAAILPEAARPPRLRVSIFERSGRFGAGEAHSDVQAKTNYMNRIAGQIALAADESNRDASKLLPQPLRPTFHEWCRTRFAETGDERFDLGKRDVPPRYLHGLALREAFDRYVALLRGLDGVAVDLYPVEATDLSPQAGDRAPYRVHAAGASEFSIPADRILFVTGHSRNRPGPGSAVGELATHGRYVPYAYPLERHVTEETVPPGCAVGVAGLGLTAIDVFLSLTEGRGGSFAATGPSGALEYVPSGREPATIVGFGPSGMLICCRPVNAKEGDPSLEHEGVFFTVEAVRTLRRRVGTPVDGGGRQLDFDRHVFPLVVLEMAYLYYKTLFGSGFSDYVRASVEFRYRAFLQTGCGERDTGVEHLLEPVERCFGEAAEYVRAAAHRLQIPHGLLAFEEMGVLPAFLSTVYGRTQHHTASSELRSPWRHSADPFDHRFDWRRALDPLATDEPIGGDEWRSRAIAFMYADHANGAQGNLENPVKAACDGVWRDLRAVFTETADRGGLLPASHRRFMSIYLRYYNRLSNGAGLEAMKKVLALVENSILDITVGPSPGIEAIREGPSFRITGGKTGVVRKVDVLVEGRTHPFDPELDAHPLYPNLLRRGLVRRWRNPGSSADDDGWCPGGLDVSETLHPVRRDGTIDDRLTFVGAPTDGVLFFQLSAARPYSNSYILNNVGRWASELVEAMELDAGALAAVKPG